nr:solute carrier family 23 protein [Microcella frigidaquae]
MWTVHGDGKTVAPGAIVAPEERLSWPRTIGFGLQHVVAMFGATFLVPILTGFPPSTTLLFSGIGTILFLLITQNRLPSYLGSSFAFIAPIQAASMSEGREVALGGVLVVGLSLALVGILVHVVGTGWIHRLLPPVVAGTIVALIGFNLAPAAKSGFQASPLTAVVTLVAVILVAVLFRGIIGRLSIIIGVVVGYLFALARGEVDFSGLEGAAAVGLPEFTLPVLGVEYLGTYLAFLPVVLALVAENVGHVKGVGFLAKRDLDPLTGRALFADGLATTIAAIGGGSATTTYGENIGVMSSTRVFSTAAYWVAAITAIVLSLSPWFGQFLFTVPAGVIGGVTTALYGLIGIIGVRMWVDAKVDFSKPKNQFTAAIALIIAIADFTVFDAAGGVLFSGIVLGTIAALVVYHSMDLLGRLRKTDVADEPVAASAD